MTLFLWLLHLLHLYGALRAQKKIGIWWKSENTLKTQQGCSTVMMTLSVHKATSTSKNNPLNVLKSPVQDRKTQSE